MKKLNVSEMMSVNGGRTATGEEWNFENGTHTIHWDDGSTTIHPIEVIEVVADRP
jgi:hypothetical protein